MGTRGPVPKRSEARRRTNSPEATKVDLAKLQAEEVEIPAADEDWHPVARQWWDSLAKSGQSRFYEPSDWATAYLMAESLSRDLSPQVVGITESGEVVEAEIPLKGASLSAYLKAMSVLMVTEGDRRRLQVELEREKGRAEAQAALAGVPSISSRRQARASKAAGS